MTGRVFEIREFCLQDGPGPRTTVFLQGCPLRCRWCQNPEGQDFCGGVERTVGEVVDEVSRTVAFLESSGGGVTFSGGEPLSQADFMLAAVNGLRARHPKLSFAVETSGYADADTYRRVASAMTLVIQDLKLPDIAGYRRWTGVDAERIFENVRWLTSSGIRHIVRIPLMPGVNDTPEAKCAFAAILAGDIGLDRVELLPYNPLAGAKYARLDRTYAPGFDERLVPDFSTTAFNEAGIPAVAFRKENKR